MSIISILELAGVAHLPRSRQLIESVILIEGYKEAQVEFGSVAGEEQANSTIDQFRDLVNRNQVQGNERNIDYWRKQGWDQFSAFVHDKVQEKSKTQIKRSKSEGQSVVLLENPRWLVVVPLDKDASCFHGKYTEWCTTKPFASYFEQYFYDKEIMLIYFLKLDSGDKWAIAAHSKTPSIEMFDKQDRSITADVFKQQTGFNPVEFRNQVFGSDEVTVKASESRRHYKEVKARVASMQPFTEVNRQLERDLLYLKDLNLIIDYCKQVKGRWPEAEPILAQSINIIDYVNNVLYGNRLPEIERLIRTGDLALKYATVVIKDRWPERESLIAREANAFHVVLSYSPFMMGRDWPEFQNRLLSMIGDSKHAIPIAIDQAKVMNRRWEALEALIANDLSQLILYAQTLKLDRLPEYEGKISRSAKYSFDYANNVTKRRFPAGEPAIIKKPLIAAAYASDVIHEAWPEAERSIATNAKAAYLYARGALNNQRFPTGEPAISADPTHAFNYAKNIIRGRFPEGEETIRAAGKWDQYEKIINKKPKSVRNIK